MRAVLSYAQQPLTHRVERILGRLNPRGGAIAVQLIRGDMSATPIGTVTHVGAQRTVAFGHPMMNAGDNFSMSCQAGWARTLS